MIQSITNFMSALHPAVYVAVATLAAAGLFYLRHKDDDKRTAVKAAREEILKLFLFAEKQEWIGEKKMEWVVEQAYLKFFPKSLQGFIAEESIEEFVLVQYKEFKLWLESEHLENIIAPVAE